jgi:hypothetical protein
MTNKQTPIPGLETKTKKPAKGRLARGVDAVIAQSRKTGAPYTVDDLTAAMLRTAAANVEAALAEGSSWAVANALKELRAVRDELVQPVQVGESDAFEKLLQDLAADVPEAGTRAP